MNGPLSFIHAEESPGGESYIMTELGWQPIVKPPSPEVLSVWEGIVERYFLCVWTRLMHDARVARQKTFDIDLGDPGTESGRAYYAANIRFVERQGISCETVHIPQAPGRSARYVLRVHI